MPTGPTAKAAKVPTGSQSVCEPYRHIIEAAVDKGLSAQRIWQDLKEDYHFSHGYCSVKRFIRKIRRHRPEVAAVMEHLPGEEAQVDFFQGPPTLDSRERTLAPALDIPDDIVVLRSQLRRASVAAGAVALHARPGECLPGLGRGAPRRSVRISNHRIRLVIVTDRYTEWWEKHRQRRTRKEIEADRKGCGKIDQVSDYIGRIEEISC